LKNIVYVEGRTTRKNIIERIANAHARTHARTQKGVNPTS